MFQLANPEDTGQGISFQGLLKTYSPVGALQTPAGQLWRAWGPAGVKALPAAGAHLLASGH